MKLLRAWIQRLAGTFGGALRERELADEIEAHLQMHIDDNLRSGLAPDEARRQAVLKLGGVESTKQACRERSSLPLLENLLQDVRFALRQLARNPAFVSLAVLMLALGLCSSAAIFAFADATLLKPLPYQQPDRLVGVYERIALCPQCNLSYLDYLDWKRLNKVFSSFDAYQGNGFTLAAEAGAQQVRGARVTADFFRTLGVSPVLGRNFYSGEDSPTATRTALLSNAVWRKRYGGSQKVLGKTVILNGDPVVIVGVLPADFHFAPVGPADYWAVLHQNQGCEKRRSCHDLYGVARLKDGISVEAAFSNLASIAKRLEKQYPDSNRGQGAAAVSLVQVIVGGVRLIMLVLLSGAGLLLLIACVNVASLLLVRSESRKREIAVRRALGASSFRIVSQFVTEAILLVGAATALGLLSGHWMMQLLTRVIPANLLGNMPYLQDLGLNVRVLLLIGALALFAVALFSFTPVLRLSSSNTPDALAEGSRGTAGMVWRRLGSHMVILELAIAMVLLVAAGLLGKSLYRLLQVPLGMEPERLATVRVAASGTRYSNNELTIALGRRLLGRLERIPGVLSAATSSTLPLNGGNSMWIRVVGRPYNGEHNEVGFREVSSGYFTTLRARLLSGRYFADDDPPKHPLVIIDQSLAKKYFPGEDPVGRQIVWAHETATAPMQIVGVVEDIKEGPLDIATWPTLYVPFNQDPTTDFSLVVRAARAEQTLLPALSAAVHEIDPGIATFDESTMSQRINDSPAAYLHRVSAWLVGGFAVLALLLGVAGLYGVIAYSVSQRTREIGVRMALGAERSAIYRLVLKEAGWLIAAGTSIGLLCAIAAATSLRDLLFGVSSWDLPTLAAVAAMLAIAALLASFIPARHAASISPVEALRAE